MAEPKLIDALGQVLREADPPPATDEAGRERFVAAVGAPVRHSRRAYAAASGFAVAAAAASVLWFSWPQAAVTYSVEGAVADAGYVRAAGASAAQVVFSEGTRMTVANGSTARIVKVDAAGAELLLEEGVVTLDVVPLPKAAWSVAAGPYTVQVTGTQFDVSWEGATQNFALDLKEGSVIVRGPSIQDGIRLTAGQILRANAADRNVSVDQSAATAGARSVAGVASVAVNAGASASAASPSNAATSRARPTANSQSWAELIADGKAEQVLAQANARGVATVLSSAGVGDLIALADAARYKGQSALARKTYTSIRARFAGSRAASNAAFLLGRLSEGGGSALGWYDAYLAEAPGGSFASEALGRKMLLLRAKSPARAKTVAKQYLAAYPKGAYASVATDLLKKRPR